MTAIKEEVNIGNIRLIRGDMLEKSIDKAIECVNMI